MKRILLLSVVLLLSSVALLAQNNQPVPDVLITTMDGKQLSIKEMVKPGQITVLSFWATWCAPCKKELDNIDQVYADWQKDYGMALIAVSVDNARTSTQVKPMVDAKGWDYTVVLDKNQDLQRALNFQDVPYTFLIDQSGNIVYSHFGYEEGAEFELEDKIAELAEK